MEEEIRIQMETIERIDNVLACENSQFCSREEFIISAIEKKLTEINDTNK